jgi:hypothetical protein
MDLATLQSLLDTHGGDPARWPGPKRPAALELVARAREAEQALAAAKALDGLLLAGLPGEAGANLRFRITAGAAQFPAGLQRDRRWLAAIAERWRLGAATAAAAASIALGMLAGMETSVATVLDDEPTQTMDLAALTYGEVDGLEDIQ